MSFADLQTILATVLMGAIAIGSSILADAARQARHQARRQSRPEEHD